MGSLSQDVLAAVQMWKSWGGNVKIAEIEQPDIPSFDVTELWTDLLSAMQDQSVPVDVEKAATTVHPTDVTIHAHGVDNMKMWDWYFFWLGVFQDSTNVLNSAGLYEDLQQYTCKVISEWMNIKYRVCILAATAQGQVFAGPGRNLVERLAWTKRIGLSEQDFQFRQISLHAMDNPSICNYRYPELLDAVKNATETPIVL